MWPRWLCGLSINSELSSVLANYGIEGNKRRAVLDAMHRAPDDDPVLVFFWDQQGLDMTGVANPKQVLLNIIEGAMPTITRAADFPDEVFNLEHLKDIVKIRKVIIENHIWARGDSPTSVPVFNRPTVARTILITNVKKKVPTFLDADLFT